MRNQSMLDVAKRENEMMYGAMPEHLMNSQIPPAYAYHGDTRIGFAKDIIGAPAEYHTLDYRPPATR